MTLPSGWNAGDGLVQPPCSMGELFTNSMSVMFQGPYTEGALAAWMLDGMARKSARGGGAAEQLTGVLGVPPMKKITISPLGATRTVGLCAKGRTTVSRNTNGPPGFELSARTMALFVPLGIPKQRKKDKNKRMMGEEQHWKR